VIRAPIGSLDDWEYTPSLALLFTIHRHNKAETARTEIPMPSTPSGRYHHYKGNPYTVIGTARHSETLEELVVYRQEYGDQALWVRPLSMFLETVLIGSEQIPRFKKIADV